VYSEKDCEWAKKNTKRCRFDSVSSHCPVTCETYECQDSQAEFIVDGAYTNCAIANEKNCKITGFFHTCRFSCGVCPSLVPSIVPSSVPSKVQSSVPSKVQSGSPSTAPSLSPSTFCFDSTYKFKTKDSDDKEFLKKNCAWVSLKLKKRCGFTNVKSHCPGTCKTCDDPCTDSTAEFWFQKSYQTCADIGIKKNCKKEDVSRTCRASCKKCA